MILDDWCDIYVILMIFLL